MSVNGEVSFNFSDLEGCAAMSGVGNKDGYSVKCGDNDGNGG